MTVEGGGRLVSCVFWNHTESRPSRVDLSPQVLVKVSPQETTEA